MNDFDAKLDIYYALYDLPWSCKQSQIQKEIFLIMETAGIDVTELKKEVQNEYLR